MMPMHKVSAVLVLALVFLVACNSTPAPAPSASSPAPSSAASAPPAAPNVAAASTGEVQQKLQEIAGSSAINCGQVRSLSADELKTAGDCAMQAAKSKKAFLVSYDLPGMSIGVAGGSDGKLFTVQSEEANGKTAPPKMQACPAELRVAQSGRVTCFPVGSMGVTPGSASPHAGQGASPHGGGMAMPPAGTSNPHKGTSTPQKSH
jgi:hypothetical protein